jgi:Protein of unknown function (DUF3551)
MGPNKRAQERERAAARAAAEARHAEAERKPVADAQKIIWNVREIDGFHKVHTPSNAASSLGGSMRIVQVAGFMAAIMVALAASARPSAAVVIYPWCANYAGKWGASSCGSVSLKQCLATLAGNGGTCDPNPFYQPYPPPPTYSPPIRR